MRYLVVVVAVVTVVGCKKDKGGGDKAAGGGGGAPTQKDFEDYASKAKASEAQLMLNRLGKTLKVYAVEQGGLPVGKSPPTPATPCCASPDHKCAPDPNNWTGEPWRTLEFTVDEPHLFQYDFESDGKTATVHAVGDLKCDGHPTTVTLTATVDASGGVATTIN